MLNTKRNKHVTLFTNRFKLRSVQTFWPLYYSAGASPCDSWSIFRMRRRIDRDLRARRRWGNRVIRRRGRRRCRVCRQLIQMPAVASKLACWRRYDVRVRCIFGWLHHHSLLLCVLDKNLVAGLERRKLSSAVATIVVGFHLLAIVGFFLANVGRAARRQRVWRCRQCST